MFDDTVDRYKGREAEWAVLCVLDGVQYDSRRHFSKDDAEALVGGAWEFIAASCSDAEVQIPNQEVVISLVRARLQE